MLGSISGFKVVESPFCVRKVWNFPESKHRSKRQHKKLIKRFGSQYYEEPAMYLFHGDLIAHPAMIEKMVKDKRIVALQQPGDKT